MPLLVILAFMTGERDAAAFDYVQNGSFEQGVDAWIVNYAQLDVAGAGEVPPVAGASSGKLTLVSSPFSLRQGTFFGVPAGSYAVSASVRRATSGTAIYLEVQSTDPNASNQAVWAGTGGNQWLTLSATVDLPQVSDVRLILGGTGVAGAVVYVDDVRFEGAPPVTKTPTPSPPPDATETPPLSATGTRTATVTRTPTPTDTPTPTPDAIGGTVRNGGFEDVDPDGAPVAWHRFGGTLGVATSPVHGGGRAARFESASDSTKWLYQAVAVDPGGVYAFGAWAFDDDPGVASAFLRVSWYASDDASGASIGGADSTTRLDAPSSGYRYLTTGGVRAPDDARSARLRVMLAPASAAHAAIYVDDAQFGPAALEPTATAAPQDGTPIVEPGDDDATPQRQVLGINRRPVRTPALGSAGPQAHSPPIVINEVLYDPDIDGADADGEWVELYNRGDAAADVGGWTLSDAASTVTLPQLRLEPRTFAVVAASDSFNDAYPGFTGQLAVLGRRIGNSLGNDGDRLELRDAAGATVDAVSWGSDRSAFDPAVDDAPAGHSIERDPAGADTNAASDFTDNARPSPGRPIEPVDAKPQPKLQPAAGSDVVASDANPFMRWAPWAIAGASAAALAAALGWRAWPALRARLRP